MDLYAKDPKESGEAAFHCNLTWWAPLAQIAHEAAPETAAKCTA